MPLRRCFLSFLFAQLLWGAPPERRVAITFDDLPFVSGTGRGLPVGEIRKHTEAILAALKHHGAPAIGFVNERRLDTPGEWEPRKEVLRLWLDAGHDLGNHTFDHEDAQRTPVADYQDAIVRGDTVTRRLLQERGRRPAWFRHPISHTGPTLEYRAAVEGFLGTRGYAVAPHTVENGDFIFNAAYVRNGNPAVKTAYLDFQERVMAFGEAESLRLFGREIPQVLLLHANRLNAETLDALLNGLKARGYRFVGLDEAIKDPAYGTEDRYAGPKGHTWLQRWCLALGKPMRASDEPKAPSLQEMLGEFRKKTP